ncbi:MAG TPA: hypothetical protein VFT82_03745 [Candidatus Paceibacterota bacterium]|nr:hypothetical protein [Candidatus Paceibacterota bacterium]
MPQIKTIQLTDQKSGMPLHMTLVVTGSGKEAYSTGPLLISIEDVFRLAEHALIHGPIDDKRKKFVKNVSELITGDSPHGISFRPSTERTMAGTATGFP